MISFSGHHGWWLAHHTQAEIIIIVFYCVWNGKSHVNILLFFVSSNHRRFAGWTSKQNRTEQTNRRWKRWKNCQIIYLSMDWMIFPANKITHNKHITFDLYHNQNTISFSLLLLLLLLFDVRCYDLYIVCVYAMRLSRTQMPTKCNFGVQTKNKNERKCMKTDRRAGVFMQQQQFVIFCTHKKKILSQYLPASQTSICYFFFPVRSLHHR